MNMEYLNNFGSKVNGIYYLKKGTIIGITYSEKTKRIAYIYTTGEYVGIDKYYYNVGLVDLLISDDVDYDFISDEELHKKLSNKEFVKEFYAFLKLYLMEVAALSKESEENALFFNIKKFNQKNNKHEGFPLEIVDELNLKNSFDVLVSKEKIYQEYGVYKIKK